jgi:hypothetical protein
MNIVDRCMKQIEKREMHTICNRNRMLNSIETYEASAIYYLVEINGVKSFLAVKDKLYYTGMFLDLENLKSRTQNREGKIWIIDSTKISRASYLSNVKPLLINAIDSDNVKEPIGED